MNQVNVLFNALHKNGGMITSQQALKLRIRKNIFSELVHKNKLVKIAQGLYALPTEEIDEYSYFSHRMPSGIFSHDTALYLHGLITRMPIIYVMTVKSGSNVSKISHDKNNIEFKYVKKELLELGKIQLQTPFSRYVSVYDKERCILDVIKSKNDIDAQIFSEALKNYFSSNDKNLLRLSEYAVKMNMEEKLRQYTEVLL